LNDGEKGTIPQRDRRTYAVASRLSRGAVPPDQLQSTADIAEKRQAAALKPTNATRIAIVGLLCTACLCLTAAEDDPPARTEITLLKPLPLRIVQGDPLQLTYRVAGGGSDVSVTAFIRSGSLEQAPDKWQEGATRFEPKYQVSHRDMRDKSRTVGCSLPGTATRGMRPGPHTLFVAVCNPPAGWEVVKLGEFEIAVFGRIDLPSRAGARRVAIRREAGGAHDTAPSIARLAELVRTVGCVPEFVTDDEMADPAVLDRTRFDVLMLPHSGAFPARAEAAILGFLEHAGSLVSLGGVPSAVGDAVVGSIPAQVVLADMEQAEAIVRLGTEHGTASGGEIRRVAQGGPGTGHVLEVRISSLGDWFYVAIPFGEAVRAETGILRFRAKGDTQTDRLCLELVESDGSRWKYFVRLTPEWRTYGVRMTDFAVYASPGRGGVADHVHLEQIVRLKMGFYRALFADNRTPVLWLDDVEAGAAGGELTEPRTEHMAEWGAQYAYLKARPATLNLGLVESMRRVAGTTRIVSAPGQHIIRTDAVLDGAISGWHVSPALDLSSDGKWASGRTAGARFVPLLEGLDAEGKRLGTLGGLVLNYRGSRRGSAWAFLCVDEGELLNPERTALQQALVHILRAVTEPLYLFDVRPTFNVDSQTLTQTWTVSVVNLRRTAQRCAVHMAPVPVAGTHTEDLLLAPGEVRDVRVTFPADGLELKRFGVHVRLACDDAIVDELTAEADALAGLTAAGDWLMSNQEENGQFSRFFYADTYGARALRVLAQLSDRTDYLASALGVTDMLVREQRPDGGWWVGYGPGRDCVFVADDGCIALALVQLAPYLDAEHGRVYLEAATKHLGFRESFRITDTVARELAQEFGPEHRGVLPGGLGVGYVRTDYFAHKPYAAAHREMRQFPWTLHCSLAFLGGLWSTRRSDAVQTLAVQDTRWFLERVEEGTDSVTNPYANEAAVWMFDTLADAALQARLRGLLRDRFVAHVAETQETWWTRSGGRGALLLAGVVYCSRWPGTGPAAKAALARAIWSLCGSTSPLSLRNVVRDNPHTVNGEVVMYVCFSALGLAELLEPRSTLLPVGASHAQ